MAGHGVAVLINLTATMLLAGLLALGVYVNVNKFIIGSDHTDGYRVMDVDTTTWNVACTVVGTAVGLLAAVAFASQDDIITRRELARDRGVVAMFLRPLTVKRGAEQVFHLQLPFERTLLVIFTIATAVTSAAVVALFGIRAITDEIANPAASYPLGPLNGSFFQSIKGGGVLPIPTPVENSQTSQLSGFLYKAAYIEGLKMKGNYKLFARLDTPYLPEQGPLGDTIYGNLNTGGVGLNMSSYLQYSGLPDGFSMPARYEFNRLNASVFGTRVNISCQNATSQYTVASVNAKIGSVVVMAVGKPGGANITLFSNQETPRFYKSFAIGSAVTVNSKTGEPTHTLVIPNFGIERAFVLECAYNGREYLADVSAVSPVSPLRIDRETLQGPLLGPYVKQRLANITHSLIAVGNMGGNLAAGFIDAEYNNYGDNNTDVATAFETTIGQVGEAYFSLLRQQVERSNLYKGGGSQAKPNGSEVRLYVTVLRLGGAQYGWLAVLAVLLVGTAVGTVRTCANRKEVEFEAQDAVKLIRSTLQNPIIRDTTRVRYEDGIVVVQEGQVPMNQPMDRESVHTGVKNGEVTVNTGMLCN